MATILYLDIDDEITTAAGRIRDAVEPAVALVLPSGSRLATSRINFRLLAREAVEHNRVLSIVAADPAARALAASAGLSAHASVAAFEEAAVAARMAVTTHEPNPSTESRVRAQSAGPTRLPRPDQELTAAAAGPIIGPTGPDVSADGREPARDAGASSDPRPRSGGASLPVLSAARGRRGRDPRQVALLVVGLVLLLLTGIVATTILPSATIVVTPRSVPLSPVSLVVRADPSATGVDVTAKVVPAQRLSKDFAANGDFTATGKRVVSATATGSVTFDSVNTVGPVAVPAGTHLSTLSGIVFLTTAPVTVPPARVAGNRISHGFASVSVRAATAGPAGDVDAGSITQVPDFLRTQQVSASNPVPTNGGTRQEFTRISQQDVAAAVAQLTGQIQNDYKSWLAAPDSLPSGATAFPKTGALGAAVPSVDPGTLVNVEQPSFQLGLTASGTVVTVDASLVRQVAVGALTVPSGQTLQAGSVAVTVGAGQPDGQIVDFRVTVTALAIPVLDVAQLRAAVRGRPVADANAILATYGVVSIQTWPGYVTTIPTLDARVELTVAAPVAAASPSPAAPARSTQTAVPSGGVAP